MDILNDINAVVRAQYLPAIAYQISKQIVFLSRLFARKKIDWRAGTEVRKVVVLDTYTVQEHDRRYDAVEVNTNDITAYGTYKLDSYVVAIGLTDDDKDKLTGPEVVVDLLGAKMQTAEISLKRQIEEMLFKNFLTTAVDDGQISAVYAGISRTQYPAWRARVNDGGGKNRVLTRILLTSLYNEVSKDGDVPTCIITTPALWTYIETTIIGDKDRFTDVEMINLGHPNFLFMGIPVLKSDHCPANTVYFLNENYLEVILHKDAKENGFTFKDFVRIPLRTVSVGELWFVGQVACVKPSAQGVLRNVTVG